MFKKLAKLLLDATPYKVVRRKKKKAKIADPLTHNTPMGMDRKFSSPSFLDKYRSAKRTRLYETLIGFIPDASLAVADFGCGPGDFLRNAIADLPTNRYYGFEYSEAAAAIARQSCPEVQIVVQDLRDPITGSFDVGICSQTLEHVLFPERALQNIVRSINVNGRIILTVPDGRQDRYRGHINFWSRESWDAWLESHLPKHITQTRSGRIENKKGFDYLYTVLDL